MIDESILKEKNLECCGLICKRDRSHIYKVRNVDTKEYLCLKRIMNDERFTHTYEKAYENYDSLMKACGGSIPLVKIIEAWRGADGAFYILMEYLEGFTRLEYVHMDKRVAAFERMLIEYGYFMIDIAPINFMVKGNQIQMVDLDTLARVDDFPVDPHKGISELSWYGSRVLKYQRGRVA